MREDLDKLFKQYLVDAFQTGAEKVCYRVRSLALLILF